MHSLKIYCDGACSGNPGPGAWGYVVFEGEKMIASACGTSADTTNNKMELQAVIQALQAFDECFVIVDSKYVMDGITNWIKKWRANGWRSSTGAVKNLELWRQLDDLVRGKNVVWEWQKGHANNVHDIVDVLVRDSVLR